MSEPVSPTPLLYCRCAYAQVLPPGVKDEVLRHLCSGDRPFESVADLCEMSARRDPRLAALAAAGPLQIVACHPRAVKWLFHAAGAPLPEGTEIVNLRSLTAEEACGQIDGTFTPAPSGPDAGTEVQTSPAGEGRGPDPDRQPLMSPEPAAGSMA